MADFPQDSTSTAVSMHKLSGAIHDSGPSDTAATSAVHQAELVQERAQIDSIASYSHDSSSVQMVQGTGAPAGLQSTGSTVAAVAPLCSPMAEVHSRQAESSADLPSACRVTDSTDAAGVRQPTTDRATPEPTISSVRDALRLTENMMQSLSHLHSQAQLEIQGSTGAPAALSVVQSMQEHAEEFQSKIALIRHKLGSLPGTAGTTVDQPVSDDLPPAFTLPAEQQTPLSVIRAAVEPVGSPAATGSQAQPSQPSLPSEQPVRASMSGGTEQGVTKQLRGRLQAASPVARATSGSSTASNTFQGLIQGCTEAPAALSMVQRMQELAEEFQSKIALIRHELGSLPGTAGTAGTAGTTADQPVSDDLPPACTLPAEQQTPLSVIRAAIEPVGSPAATGSQAQPSQPSLPSEQPVRASVSGSTEQGVTKQLRGRLQAASPRTATRAATEPVGHSAATQEVAKQLRVRLGSSSPVDSATSGSRAARNTFQGLAMATKPANGHHDKLTSAARLREGFSAAQHRPHIARLDLAEKAQASQRRPNQSILQQSPHPNLTALSSALLTPVATPAEPTRPGHSSEQKQSQLPSHSGSGYATNHVGGISSTLTSAARAAQAKSPLGSVFQKERNVDALLALMENQGQLQQQGKAAPRARNNLSSNSSPWPMTAPQGDPAKSGGHRQHVEGRLHQGVQQHQQGSRTPHTADWQGFERGRYPAQNQGVQQHQQGSRTPHTADRQRFESGRHPAQNQGVQQHQQGSRMPHTVDRQGFERGKYPAQNQGVQQHQQGSRTPHTADRQGFERGRYPAQNQGVQQHQQGSRSPHTADRQGFESGRYPISLDSQRNDPRYRQPPTAPLFGTLPAAPGKGEKVVSAMDFMKMMAGNAVTNRRLGVKKRCVHLRAPMHSRSLCILLRVPGLDAVHACWVRSHLCTTSPIFCRDVVIVMVCSQRWGTGGRRPDRMQRQQPVEAAPVPSVTISDNMTMRQLAFKLRMTMPDVEEKLAALGETVASHEDLCALRLHLCAVCFAVTVAVLLACVPLV
jgi:hypothetical protein